MKMNGEPTLSKIDDYNGKESAAKRWTVRLIVIGLLVLGAIYVGIKSQYSFVDDYVGTKDAPGINTAGK